MGDWHIAKRLAVLIIGFFCFIGRLARGCADGTVKQAD